MSRAGLAWLLTALLGSALSGRCAATGFGDTAPEGVQISMSAEELGGKSGEEYMVVDKSAVLPNWVAQSAVPAITKKPAGTGVELENVDSTKFLMRTTGLSIKYARPIVVVGNHSVLSPTITGAGHRGGYIKNKAKQLTIKYNCLEPGWSSVLLSIPFAKSEIELDAEEEEAAKSAGTDHQVDAFHKTSFTWVVKCPSRPRHGFTVQIVGDAGTSSSEYRTAANIVEDGAAIGAWKADLNEQGTVIPSDTTHMFEVPAEQNATRFIVSMQAGGGQTHQQVFLKPGLVVEPAGIANPIISGRLQNGGTAYEVLEGDGEMQEREIKLFGQVIKIGGAGKYGELDIQYNCHSVGVATVTVAIPFPDDNYAPVLFSWRKVCGGGEHPQIKIATSTGAVVLDKGQVQEAWQPETPSYEVAGTDSSTTFKITKHSGSIDSGPLKFGIPTVSVEPSGVLNPSIEGNGRKGGQIEHSKTVNGGPFDALSEAMLKVTYNCQTHGSATVTMVVPLPMHDDLHWAWKKTCGGLYRQYLSVSTVEKAVVRDGVTFDDWNLEYAGEPLSATIDSRDDTVSFFLTIDADDSSGLHVPGANTEDWNDWLDAADMPVVPPNMAVQTYERPLVTTSSRAICNPALGGIASKGGTIASYGDGTSGQQQLDVKFNCLKQGIALVTITIPLQVYEDVVFTMTKVCKKEPALGWMIGTAPGEEDVVADGLPWTHFDFSPSADGHRMVVDRSVTFSSFFVWFKETGSNKDHSIAFGAPIVTASPDICSPRISGEMRKGGELSAATPMLLTVRYNCVVGGSTVITVRIPIVDEEHDAVVFAWRKNNGPNPTIEAIVERKKAAIPHTFNIVVVGIAVAVILFAAYTMCSKSGQASKTAHLQMHATPLHKTSHD